MSQLSSLTRGSIPSPLTTQLPHLSPTEIASLPYPPDVFPGARDVTTPYGSMRVYEWGNEDGRKVMMVHGDATSAPLWKRVAKSLVEKGCRVIVLDLWGRGYSSTPLVPHDGRLLALQLLFAASSSSLPWCTEGFSVVGFSLGGGITMDFVASFPHLVRSVALLAPVGLLRSLPHSYIELKQAAQDGKSVDALRPLLASALGVDEEDAEAEGAVANAEAIKRWQFEHHQGQATSFISTLLHGPVVGQHDVWRDACTVMKEKKNESFVVLCGDSDWVVPAEHVKEDLDGMMGEAKFVFGTVPGGHGFLLDEESCGEVVERLGREWRL